MNNTFATKVVDAICDIVNDTDTPWTERRDAVRDACNPDAKIALEEFLSWFEDDEA